MSAFGGADRDLLHRLAGTRGIVDAMSVGVADRVSVTAVQKKAPAAAESKAI